MRGSEHYREAERLLAEAARSRDNAHWNIAAQYSAEAQVHATLALAAATIRVAPVETTGMSRSPTPPTPPTAPPTPAPIAADSGHKVPDPPTASTDRTPVPDGLVPPAAPLPEPRW